MTTFIPFSNKFSVAWHQIDQTPQGLQSFPTSLSRGASWQTRGTKVIIDKKNVFIQIAQRGALATSRTTRSLIFWVKELHATSQKHVSMKKIFFCC